MQKGVGKNLQDAGEQFSAAVQRGAESVRDNLQGTQADATSKAKSAASTAESKAKQTTNGADGIGAKISNSLEDAKVMQTPCSSCSPFSEVRSGCVWFIVCLC